MNFTTSTPSSLLQEQPPQEQKIKSVNENVLSYSNENDDKQQDFRIKIVELLNNLKYQQLQQYLKFLFQKHETHFNHKNQYVQALKNIFLKQIANHLKKLFKITFNNTQDDSNQIQTNFLQFDVDAILQLIVLSIPLSSSKIAQSKKDNITIQNILTSIIRYYTQTDLKYIFIVYRSKCMLLIHHYANQLDLLGTIRYFKYLSGIQSLTQKLILQSVDSMFKQFLQMLSEARLTFEKLYQYQGIINNSFLINQKINDLSVDQEEVQQQNIQLVKIIHEEYINLCLIIVENCIQILTKKNINIQKTINIVKSLISQLIIILSNTKINEATKKNLIILKNNLVKLLEIPCTFSSNYRPLSIQCFNIYPSIILLQILQNRHINMLISKQSYFYILFKLFIEYSQQNTIGKTVGGKRDLIYNKFIQITSIFSTYFIQISQNIQKFTNYSSKVRIQNQILYLSDRILINLPSLYYKLSIFFGFLSSSHQPSQLCQSKIRKILSLPFYRYSQSFCPISSVKIWSKFLQWSKQSEIQYRIFSLTQYRKLLVSHYNRRQILEGRFQKKQGHMYHRHFWILIDAYQKICFQINIVIRKAINLNYNYIGHIISFVSNYLLCFKIYKNAEKLYDLNVFQKQRLKAQRQEIQLLFQELKCRLQKNLQIQNKKKDSQIKNDDSCTLDLQLVTFRCKEIKFDQ